MALQNQEIAGRLRELRKSRGNPPQTVVAEKVGVSERTYQTWELGEAKPSYRSLEKVAAYFGVSEDFILSGTAAVPDPFAGQPQLTIIEQKIDRNCEMLERGLEAIADLARLTADQAVAIKRAEVAADEALRELRRGGSAGNSST